MMNRRDTPLFGDFMETARDNRLISRCCREDDWEDKDFIAGLRELEQSPSYRKYRDDWQLKPRDRKEWEFAYIISVFLKEGLLVPGKRGIGFAVGQEPLPAYFASKGVDILASDLSGEDAQAQAWKATNQNAGSTLLSLCCEGTDREAFKKHVRYRDINMNALPLDEEGYDFAWSSCAIEHVGSLEKSKTFLCNMLNVLKMGGVAVHTTEFNLTSNEKTLEIGGNAIWRKRDVEEIQAWLKDHGHKMEVSFARGQGKGDFFVDTPPYRTKSKDYHLCLKLEDYVSTSFAFVIRKGAATDKLWVLPGDTALGGGLPQPEQQADAVKRKGAGDMLVYGVGAHLQDMLNWHPDLAGRIERIFDKDPQKTGTVLPGVGKTIESPEALRGLPPGTQIAISAIRYYREIAQEIGSINPGLICLNIDDAYQQPEQVTVTPAGPSGQAFHVSPMGQAASQQCLQGLAATERWRREFFMQCVQRKHVFWGTRGARAVFLRRAFVQLMGPGDIFIDYSPALHGSMLDGLPVCSPEAVYGMASRFVVIVMTEDYESVRADLAGRGYIENVDFVEGRRLLGEDENGPMGVPYVDKRSSAGMIVYGLGAHLQDMLGWHPQLKGRIARLIDKDHAKVGMMVPGVGVRVEPPEVFRDLPAGTEIAVSAIRYLAEITREIHGLNPGLLCRNIDEIWQEYAEPDTPVPVQLVQNAPQSVQVKPVQNVPQGVQVQPSLPGDEKYPLAVRDLAARLQAVAEAQAKRQALARNYD